MTAPALPLRRVATLGLAEAVRSRLAVARARRTFAAAAEGDHRLGLELAAAARRSR